MSKRYVEIISIGNEILNGRTINSNATSIAKSIEGTGLVLRWGTTVGDDHEDILNAFAKASERAKVVIVTGGLGPTHDDITKKALCDFFNTTLQLNKKSLENIVKRLEHRGIEVNDSCKLQAHIPKKASIIVNSVGTAPGLQLKNKKNVFFALPGVPHEMEKMMHEYVVPYLEKHLSPKKRPLSLTLRTMGVSEAILYEKLDKLEWLAANTNIAFLPIVGGVDIAIKASTEKSLEKTSIKMQEKLSEHIYGENKVSIEQVIGQMLIDKNKTISVAESCSGGLLASTFTNTPGSSEYFESGAVTYSNDAKIEILKVKPDTILKHGAVSEQCAREMARGARRLVDSDIAMSTTGIAGPGGGTPTKPVGLVYIGYCDEDQCTAHSFHFDVPREIHKQRTVKAALHLLWQNVKNMQKKNFLMA